MIKHLVILFFTFLIMACSQEPAVTLGADGICEEPRPAMCTMQYDPVCAETSGELKEYGNACSACGDPEVKSYQLGTCP
ncbi:hypothetical protein ACVFI8_07120 [Agarivorans sp. MS3-6]